MAGQAAQPAAGGCLAPGSGPCSALFWHAQAGRAGADWPAPDAGYPGQPAGAHSCLCTNLKSCECMYASAGVQAACRQQHCACTVFCLMPIMHRQRWRRCAALLRHHRDSESGTIIELAILYAGFRHQEGADARSSRSRADSTAAEHPACGAGLLQPPGASAHAPGVQRCSARPVGLSQGCSAALGTQARPLC